ncbi:BTAD domain-containing putative transcriptional regulator, partial [Streptomyces sp. B1866]|uniref:AfsR/SARP family transcriptional regulator n=1 Tax=Streptomyces sp. B1866 TaxID=3075431 RepID=UPI00288F7520
MSAATRAEGRLLGPVTLIVDGVDATPSATGTRTVLASLLLRAGRTVPAETLIGELWDDSPPVTARAQIQTHVSRLRRQVDRAHGTHSGHSLLARHPVGYALLVDAQDVDAFRFTTLLDRARARLAEGRYEGAGELLRTALDLWRGPALAGVTAGTALAAEARRLEEHRLEALSLRIDTDLHLGRHDRAIPDLRALADQHPRHETFHAQLARALDAAGRITEARAISDRLATAPRQAALPGDQRPSPPGPPPPDRRDPPVPSPALASTGLPRVAPPTAPGRTPRLRFALLGPVRAWRGDERINTGSPQQTALLSALLLRGGRTVTAPELVDGLWGDTPPDAAVAALRTYASRLRKAFGADADVLVSESGGYAVRVPDGALDIEAAERLAADAEKAQQSGDRTRARELLVSALRLWHGEPLAGVPGPYAEGQRNRLAEWHLILLENRLALDLETGLHAEAVSELTALTAQQPLRERLRELLMLALYRSGRQAEALAVYADVRRLLADELGVDPRPELSELQQRILWADADLAAPAVDRGAAQPVAVRPRFLPATVPDFTGRAAFVDELAQHLATAETRVTTVSAIAGTGGVGKTTLAAYVAHRVRTLFPDGQLYAALQGTGPVAAEPEAVLGAFLRALGTAESAIPDGLDERAAQFRVALDERRVLVLLDNARDAA